MNYFHILLLAMVQGITEFLPISSSAHLILLPQVMHWEDQGLEIDVAVHLGTLLAVMLYFYKDVFSMAIGFFDLCQNPQNQTKEHYLHSIQSLRNLSLHEYQNRKSKSFFLLEILMLY